MKKILVTSPVSIAGCLITRGFASAFKELGYFVVEKDVRELTFEFIEQFKPDVIFGYGYGYLFNETLAKHLANKKIDTKFVYYFADEPQNPLGYGKRPELYQMLKDIKNKTVFIWDKEFLNDFEGSHYLPLAVNPDSYHVTFEKYNYPISFVGRPLGDKRQRILSKIVQKYPNKLSIFSWEDHFSKSVDEIREKKLLDKYELENYKKCYKGFVNKENELAQIYGSTKININITEQGQNNLNYRVFEVPASGGFLITDKMKDLYELFNVGRDLEVYSTDDDLLDKIDFYLKNHSIAQKIAINGYSRIIREHTFSERARKAGY